MPRLTRKTLWPSLLGADLQAPRSAINSKAASEMRRKRRVVVKGLSVLRVDNLAAISTPRLYLLQERARVILWMQKILS